ncbi:hypothetical protein GGS24DRAFT_443422 [Hypoxylon argillaceum]|nr:hypothetical protein GGS24DRAFT_443422 [Hypoxylon argillaceum]
MERTERSVLMLTKLCISKFEELIALHTPRRVELESRLADFNLWADGVGALSKPGSSLDSRLQGRVNDLALVKNVLISLADSLDYFKDVAVTETSFDECIQNLSSAIGNLALIGVAIRRTGKASRNRRADRTFNPDAHHEFRTHLECIALLRPTGEPLFHQTENGDCVVGLDPSKLTALQNRLIDANLRRRHNFYVAQKRSKHQKQALVQLSIPAVIAAADNPLQGRPPPNVQNAVDPQSPRPHLISKDPDRPPPTISGFSLASTAEGTLQDTSAVKRYDLRAAKTQITSIASDAEFPQPPPIPLGRQVAKCPCCCQSLPVEIFTNPKTWKQHIIEDLCPYTCVADNCPTPQLLFCTRSEWENHVRQSHLPRWKCPFCDERDTHYPTMESIGNHLQIEHGDELLEHSFPTLLSWSAVQTMGIKSCPLCTTCGPEDSSEVVDHVLQHAYEFALRALPWPPPTIQDLNILPGNFKLPGNPKHAEDIQQWINMASYETVEVPVLALCDYDRANHSIPAPTGLSEYTDHFLTNEYFNESPEDKSSRPQSGASVASNYSTISMHSDITNSSVTSARSENWGALLQANEQSLYHRLRLMTVRCDKTHTIRDFSDFSFLPLDAINKALTIVDVKAQSPWYEFFRTEILERVRKVFAILGLCMLEAHIRDLFNNGLTDEHLPLVRGYYQQQTNILFSQGKEFKSFLKWKGNEVDQFLRNQWLVLAPVFTQPGEQIRIDKHAPLPFYNIKRSETTGWSILYKGTLHAAHIIPKPTHTVKIAIKSYIKHDDFDKERHILEVVQILNNPHLIQHIAAIEQDDRFYIIFPWADGGNLSDFWIRCPNPLPTRGPSIVLWCLQQMAGLVNALVALHDENCRHNNLKPKHILYFRDSKERNKYGTLVIAGLHRANQHHFPSFIRHDPEITRASIPYYEPPEASIAAPKSRKYDMWAIGCIFMEFAIWLLYGSNAIDAFRNQRDGEGSVFFQYRQA